MKWAIYKHFSNPNIRLMELQKNVYNLMQNSFSFAINTFFATILKKLIFVWKLTKRDSLYETSYAKKLVEYFVFLLESSLDLQSRSTGEFTKWVPEMSSQLFVCEE